jgi:hypothetical protein
MAIGKTKIFSIKKQEKHHHIQPQGGGVLRPARTSPEPGGMGRPPVWRWLQTGMQRWRGMGTRIGRWCRMWRLEWRFGAEAMWLNAVGTEVGQLGAMEEEAGHREREAARERGGSGWLGVDNQPSAPPVADET